MNSRLPLGERPVNSEIARESRTAAESIFRSGFLAAYRKQHHGGEIVRLGGDGATLSLWLLVAAAVMATVVGAMVRLPSATRAPCRIEAAATGTIQVGSSGHVLTLHNLAVGDSVVLVLDERAGTTICATVSDVEVVGPERPVPVSERRSRNLPKVVVQLQLFGVDAIADGQLPCIGQECVLMIAHPPRTLIQLLFFAVDRREEHTARDDR